MAAGTTTRAGAPTKVLFLDVDGVLNSGRSSVAFDGYPHSFSDYDMARFDHVSVGLIRRVCEKTDCAVVLSSDWRYNYSAHQVANALDLPVIGCTPIMGMAPRGAEIDAWLAEHPEVTRFAIIDDMAEMFYCHPEQFVQTSGYLGVTLTEYNLLCKILGVIEAKS